MNWTRLMPAIPLAHGVPTTEGIVVGFFANGTANVTRPGFDVAATNAVRVDLDDDLGFAYALRYAAVELGLAPAFLPLAAWIRGEVNDADRQSLAIAIARAIAEKQAAGGAA